MEHGSFLCIGSTNKRRQHEQEDTIFRENFSFIFLYAFFLVFFGLLKSRLRSFISISSYLLLLLFFFIHSSNTLFISEFISDKDMKKGVNGHVSTCKMSHQLDARRTQSSINYPKKKQTHIKSIDDKLFLLINMT